MIRQGNIQLRSVFGAGPEDQQQSGSSRRSRTRGRFGWVRWGIPTWNRNLQGGPYYIRGRRVISNTPRGSQIDRERCWLHRFLPTSCLVGVTRRPPVRCHAFPLREGASLSLFSAPPHLLSFPLLPLSIAILDSMKRMKVASL